MLDIFTVELVSVLKMSALETPTRELSEDVLFGIGTIGTIGTLLVVEQSSLENRPGEGVMVLHTHSCKRVIAIWTDASGNTVLQSVVSKLLKKKVG